MIGIHSNNPYWRDIPVRRMWKLLAAAFFAFANVGFFVDLVGWGLLSISEALGWVALVGAFAVGVTAAASKKRVLIPVVVMIYVISTFVFASRPHTTKQAPLPPTAYRRLLFDAIGMMAASIIAASLFMTFANSEGTQMVALETELELAARLQHTLVPAVELKVGDLELFARTIPSQKSAAISWMDLRRAALSRRMLQTCPVTGFLRER